MRLKSFLISVCLAALAVVMVSAQGPGPRAQGGIKGPRQLKQGPPPLGLLDGPLALGGPNAERRLTRALDLNATQQNQVHTALEEQQVLLKGLPERAGELRTQLAAAVRGGDEGKIDQIARDLAQVAQQQTAIRAKTAAKIYGALNADQKARMDRALNRDLGLRGGLKGKGRLGDPSVKQ